MTGAAESAFGFLQPAAQMGACGGYCPDTRVIPVDEQAFILQKRKTVQGVIIGFTGPDYSEPVACIRKSDTTHSQKAE